MCFGGQGYYSAKQIGNRLNQIPYDVYVEPMLGRGQVYKHVNHEGKKEILNDLDCTRLKQAKDNICRIDKQCQAFKKAEVSCKKDYDQFLKKYDQKGALIYLDPPYETSNSADKGYREKKLGLDRFISAVKGIKNANVAISYANNNEFKREICQGDIGFKCVAVKKKIFGTESTEILAIKKEK